MQQNLKGYVYRMQIYTRKNAEADATGLCTLNCGI